LRKIFEFYLNALIALFDSIPSQLDRNIYTLLSRLLAISESVLSWSFVPSMAFGKRLVGLFEAEQNPPFKPGCDWLNMLLGSDVPELFFKVFSAFNLPPSPFSKNLLILP
jgi:hypothetical protein